MLTIHQPFPVIKAGIGGIVTLATGFYGTITLLHAVVPIGDNIATNQSKTTKKPDANASVSTTSKQGSGGTNPSSANSSPQPASPTIAKPTTVNNYTAQTPQAQATSTVAAGAATSPTSALQVQPSSGSGSTSGTATNGNTTTVTPAPAPSGPLTPVLNTLPVVTLPGVPQL